MKNTPIANFPYVAKRHELIPMASRLTEEQFKGKTPRREEEDYAFHRHMTVLAIEAGLMDPGNLVIFDAEELPRTSAYYV